MYTRETATRITIAEALLTVDSKYGLSSLSPKHYHNTLHTLEVISAARAIGNLAVKKGLLELAVLDLLSIEAAWHDVEQDLGMGDNETASADFALAEMSKFGVFSEEDKKQVRLGIEATAVKDIDGVVTQFADLNSLMAQIMADADLSSLGYQTDEYWHRAKNLFKERHPGQVLEGEALRSFADQQTKLLARHVFYTPDAAELFPYQAENLSFVKSLL
jgi:predicted metal-dependent HD superfamily phosphohydrolase